MDILQRLISKATIDPSVPLDQAQHDKRFELIEPHEEAELAYLAAVINECGRLAGHVDKLTRRLELATERLEDELDGMPPERRRRAAEQPHPKR